MGLITTVLLLFMNLAASLAMAWWLKSILASLLLFVLLALGVIVFLMEEQASPILWRIQVGYWSLSLANVMGLYLATKASGLLLVLLIINLIALLRAISRLDAQEAGIVWPVTEAGLSPSHPPSAAPSPSSALSPDQIPHLPARHTISPHAPLSGTMQGPALSREEEPRVQVELETYKDGDNAVPIISKPRSLREFKALMKQVSRVSKKLSSRRRQARPRRRISRRR